MGLIKFSYSTTECVRSGSQAAVMWNTDEFNLYMLIVKIIHKIMEDIKQILVCGLVMTYKEKNILKKKFTHY